MNKITKHLNLALLIALVVACWGEFILCFARGYEELWYTIAIPSVIVSVLAVFGFKTRNKWLFFVGTAIVLAGAVLLIGFPSYIMFLALILGALSLAAEIVLLVIWLRARKAETDKSVAR